MLILSALFFFISILESGCASHKAQAVLNNDWIRFGHGGGVMGKEYTSLVKKDGEIRQDGAVLGELTTKQQSQLKKNLETLGIERIVYNEPGNLYRFLEIEDPVHGWRRIVWDPGNPNAPDGLNLIYDFLEYLKSKQSK